MQQDLAAFRASKNGSSSVVSSAPTGSTGGAPDISSNIAADLKNFRANPPVKKDEGGGIGGIVKSLFSAPATIIARPFQAVQGAVQYAQDKPALDKFTSSMEGSIAKSNALADEYKQLKASGADLTDIRQRISQNTKDIADLNSGAEPILNRKQFSGYGVAEAPQNFKDVEKDIGRAIQTVALGTGAPIAGGAAFGLGSSLEQGNDLFSAQTAINTALGGAGGKVLEWVGKPLFNAAGKVVGTITPQIIKDVASKGAGAIQKFAEEHSLLGGALAKTSEKIGQGFEAVDNKIGETAGRLFKGGASKAGDLVASQYPGLSKQALQDRYAKIDAENFAKPTTIPEAKYKKSTEIFQNAKDQGTDLSKEAVANGIHHDSIIEGKNYNTVDTAEGLRSDAIKTSHDLIRPALAAAEPGVQKVPIAEVRSKMLENIDKIPSTQVTDEERALMRKRVNNQYADNSAASFAHPDGYSLTDLHDNKIVTGTNGKYKPNGTTSDNIRAHQSRKESEVFRTLLEQNAPKELEIGKFNKAIQKKFQLADYLESLHGKKVPMGIVQRAVDLLGKVTGASVGSSLGGGLGGVAGYHLGGVLFDSFENLSNPLKAKYLNSLEKESPAVFKAFKDYLGQTETERLLRLKLPAPGQSSYEDPKSIFYTSPKGSTSTVKSEAIDAAARDSGAVKTPKAGPQQRKKIQRIGEMLDPYVPPKDLPVIRQKNVGKQKRLKELYDHLPTIR